MEADERKNYTLEGFLNFSKLLQTLKKSVSFAARYERGRLSILVVLVTITAIIPYLQNGLFGKLIDTTISYQNGAADIRTILFTVAFLIIATLMPSVVSLVRGFVGVMYRFNIFRNFDLYFFRKTSNLDIATIESSEYQDLAQKASERGTMSIYSLLEHSQESWGNLIGVAVSLVILGFLDKILLAYAFCGALPALYVQLRYGKNIFWIWDLNANNRRTYFNRRAHFNKATALTELKLYQLSKRFLAEITRLLNAFDDELKEAERSKLGWEFAALAAFAVFLGFGMWRIVHLALAGVMPVGQMLFAYTTYRAFKGTLGNFFKHIGIMAEWANYAGYWFAIDELRPKIESKSGAGRIDFRGHSPRIEFHNVSFRYDERHEQYALKNLSFAIEPGQKVAVVGLSGAGKTTLIKLLCRIYDPETGHILVGGADLKDLNLESWQEQLGVLFQDFTTYEFPVREAIAIGDSRKEPDENKIIAAAKMAKADAFIELLPKKYDTLLWKGFEDGVDLSKGERQRMALARVLYRESPITILDEPTASVDALAEQEIFETLEKLPGDRTVILISHRFSTVKNADAILVIEHGELIEQGTHAELMKEGGRYAQLYRVQAESYR